MQLSNLNPNADNPRKITDKKLKELKKALDEFGDLGGIVYNRRTQRIVGGHQRQKALPEDAEIDIQFENAIASKSGTVAGGYIKVGNETYSYREVDWDEGKEKAANIAANKGAGEWDMEKLGDWFKDLDEMNFDLDLTMFDEEERKQFFGESESEEEQGLTDPDSIPEDDRGSESEDDDERDEEEERLIVPESFPEDERIIQGDCLEKLKEFPDNSFDALVTDPPAGIAFMGKKWDEDKGGRDQWVNWLQSVMQEVLRVLKPGAHGLVWALPRTSHWTATALENAGFEIRDSIVHIFGCLSEDSELLTLDGWKQYKDIEIGQETVCYDIEDDSFQIGNIEDIFIYDYSDTAYRIHSDNTDQIVSKNHRCIVERNGRKIFQTAETCKSQESIPILEDMQSLLKALCSNDQGTSDKKPFLFNGLSRETAFKRTVGNKENPASYLQAMWNRILDKVHEGFKSYSLFLQMRWKKQIAVAGNACSPETNFIQYERSRAQRQEIWGSEPILERRRDLQEEQRKLHRTEICEMPAAIRGNGTKRWLCNGTSSGCGEMYRQSINQDRSSASYKSQNKRQSNQKLNVVCDEHRTQTIRGKGFTKSDLVRIEPIEYIGKVWCIKVPTGAFVARRNGKIFVTGNSGFPKSTDISKAIDKMKGAEREVVGENPNNRPNSMIGKERTAGMQYKICQYQPLTAPASPEAKQWEGWGTALKPAHEAWILVRKPLGEKTVADNVLKHGTGGLNIDASRITFQSDKDFKSATFGTQPNLRNSDGKGRDDNRNMFQGSIFNRNVEPNKNGRFPANLLLSHHPECKETCSEECAVKGLDDHSGILKTGGDGRSKQAGFQKDYVGSNGGLFDNETSKSSAHTFSGDTGGASRFFYQCHPDCAVKGLDDHSGILANKGTVSDYGPGNSIFGIGQESTIYKDIGGASRFFYCSKASKKDRNSGLENMPLVKSGMMDDMPAEERDTRNQNFHPTVKSTKLMKYLIKLISPPGGTILEPFAGSGSTLVAANRLGFDFIGIEKEDEYFKIAQVRLWKSKQVNSNLVRIEQNP